MAAHPAPYLCDGRTDGWTDRQTNCVPTKTRTDTNELAFCCPFGGRHSLGAHLNASRNNGERRAGHLVSFRDHYQNISPKRPARCRHATQRNTTQHNTKRSPLHLNLSVLTGLSQAQGAGSVSAAPCAQKGAHLLARFIVSGPTLVRIGHKETAGPLLLVAASICLPSV